MPNDTPPTTSGREWIAAFATELGMEVPDDAAIDTLLDMAGVAAHASERIAAPIACWLVGRAGLTPGEALEAARRI